MLALLISAMISIAFIITCIATHLNTGATVAIGIAGFLVPQVLIGFLIRKKIAAVQSELQNVLMRAQKQMNRKIQQFQSKPGGNAKLIQRQIENDQKALFQDALTFIDNFEPFKKWNPLMGRQIATMRLQFLYQLKEFDQVDEILKTSTLFTGPLMMEPMTVAMKMARQFKNNDIAGVEKSFKNHISWFRGERGILLYGIMSWVYVKQGEAEKARQLLYKAKGTTSNETFANNWELLSNGKEGKLSNAGLGEEWLALG
jgi:hypothetical protein